MEYYVGLDVSLKQTSICVVDQTGSVVREGVVVPILRRSQFM
jgi:transposase